MKLSRSRGLTMLACGLLAGAIIGCERPSVPPVAAKPKTAISPYSEQEMRDAALAGKADIVKQALAGGIKVDAIDADGHTSLMLAAFDGHTDVVKTLIKAGAELDRVDAAGRTALMYAASGPNLETVNALLDAGASIDLIDGGEGWSALMFAAAEGQTDVVKILLNHHADTTLVDVDGEDALSFATENDHREVMQILSVNTGKPTK